MSEGLGSCPSCGPGTRVEEFIPLPDKYKGFLAVICRECGMRGPRDTWDVRTPAPAAARLLVAAKEARSLLVRGNHPAAIQVAREVLDAAIAAYEAEEV